MAESQLLYPVPSEAQSVDIVKLQYSRFLSWAKLRAQYCSAMRRSLYPTLFAGLISHESSKNVMLPTRCWHLKEFQAPAAKLVRAGHCEGGYYNAVHVQQMLMRYCAVRVSKANCQTCASGPIQYEGSYCIYIIIGHLRRVTISPRFVGVCETSSGFIQ